MAGELGELSPEFIHSMEGNLDALRSRWESLETVYGLEPVPVFWMLLNSLVMIAAEKKAPPATIDIYLRHMELHRDSLLNLYRQTTPDRGRCAKCGILPDEKCKNPKACEHDLSVEGYPQVTTTLTRRESTRV